MKRPPLNSVNTHYAHVSVSAAVSGLTTQWVKYSGTLTCSSTDTNAKLVVLARRTGDVYLDFISLFPSATFSNRANGARVDMATALRDIHYKFIRFPPVPGMTSSWSSTPTLTGLTCMWTAFSN